MESRYQTPDWGFISARSQAWEDIDSPAPQWSNIIPSSRVLLSVAGVSALGLAVVGRLSGHKEIEKVGLTLGAGALGLRLGRFVWNRVVRDSGDQFVYL